MTKISGKAVRYLELSLKQKEDILYDLGKTLYKIHNIDKQPFLDCKLFPNDIDSKGVKSRLEYEFDWKIKRLNDVSKKDFKYALDLKDKLLKTIIKLDEFVPIHTNPSISHTFVNDEFNFSGLIDFGDAIISHPVLDIKIWNMLDRPFLLKGYFSTSSSSKNFQNILNVAYALDNIIEILKDKKTILFIKDMTELL